MELVCRVVDAATGRAIPGARVRFDFPAVNTTSNSYQTDASGQCRIKPATSATAGPPLWCLADGYAAKKIEWDEIEPIVASNSFSVKLESGSSGGGLILDERGQPLANAQVFVQSALEGGRTQVFSPDDFHFEQTGMDGRWTCRHLPAQLKDTTLRVLHGGFAPVILELDRGATDGSRSLSAEELRSGTAILFAQRGVTVTGVVVDSLGKPVEGAKILSEDYPIWTPVDGRFTLKNCRPGENAALIQAKGFAPQIKTFDVAKTSEAMRWELTPSPGLRLKVTDSRGRPLPNVAVKVEKWSGPIPREWRSLTDVDGRMTWYGAPTSNVFYSITKPGFEPLTAQPLAADGRERMVKLRKTLTVSGRVTDAMSGGMVGGFLVVPGRVHDDHHHWDKPLALNASGGQFTVTLPGAGLPHVLKVQADGYYPEVSRPFRDDEEDAMVDFALQRGEKVSGIVHNANNRPVGDASIARTGGGKAVLLGNGQFDEHDQSDVQKTDDAGRFLFQPRRDAETVVAVHESEGFAETPVQELGTSSVVVLRPWGRLEGTLLIRGQPAANELVGLSKLGSQTFLFHMNAFTALTDNQGRFTIEKIPTGRHLIGRVIRAQFSHARAVEIQPGKSTRLIMAGSGRTVAGRVLASDESADWEGWNHPAFLRASVPPLEQPEFKDPAQQRAWQRAYWSSAAGQARQIANVPYVLTLESNGRFHADDVPPGDYDLEIHYHQAPASSDGPENCRGILKRRITVPEAPPGQPYAPFEIGTIALSLKATGE